jgi:hypothetical protein
MGPAQISELLPDTAIRPDVETAIQHRSTLVRTTAGSDPHPIPTDPTLAQQLALRAQRRTRIESLTGWTKKRCFVFFVTDDSLEEPPRLKSRLSLAGIIMNRMEGYHETIPRSANHATL